MSTSLLYHAFGLVGYHYVNQTFKGGEVAFRIEQPRERHRCSACGSAEVWDQGGVEREFHAVPIGSKPVRLKLKVPRVLCFDCGKVRQVKIGFADPGKRYTRAFERYVLELSRLMTIQDVAKHLQITWDTVKGIVARSLERRFGKPNLHKLKKIAIDEIAIAKGHVYVTVVLDLISGAVVFVGDGKGVDSLKPFWQRLRRARAKIVAVATDMSKAYIRAVRDNLPKTVHVFDHFHVVKLFNEKLTAFRRELYRQLSSDAERKILKGTRWLLLKNPENLDPERNERAASGRSARTQPAAGDSLLPQGRPAADLASGQQARRPARVAGLARPRPRLGHQHVGQVRRHLGGVPGGRPGVLQLPDLDWSAGGNQQQNQDHETPSLRLP